MVDVSRVSIFDTTLRDGEQAPGAAMRLEQKLAVAEQLEMLRVDVIEAGFPMASADDAAAVAAVAKQCHTAVVCAFARAKQADIQAAADAIRLARAPRISVVMPVSDLHLRHILRMERDTALSVIQDCIRKTRNVCPEVEFIAADVSRSDLGFMSRAVAEAIDAGATHVTLADTVGYATPHDVASYFDILREKVSSVDRVILGIHCHNDLGMATINSLQAIVSGAKQVHCTIGGMGERAGNAALEEVVAALAIRQDRFPYSVNIDLSQLWPACHQIAGLLDLPIPPNKAILGANAFAHGSGMHQDGMLKAAGAFEVMDPSRVGAPGRELPITRHSGRRGLAARVEKLGYLVTPEQLDELMRKVKEKLSVNKILSDPELVNILAATKSISKK
jgi:2-isopropylmalate synthase